MSKPEPPRPVTHAGPAGQMVSFMRSMMGLAPSDGMQREDVVTLGCSLRSRVDTLDAEGWIAWCMAGLAVFALSSEGAAPGASRPWVPSLRAARNEAQRLVLVLAMQRHGGNISRAARALGTSRRATREHLRTTGLYPWLRVVGQPSDEGGETRDSERLEADMTPRLAQRTTRAGAPAPSRTAMSIRSRRVVPRADDAPRTDGHRDTAGVERRDVEPSDVAEKLRGMLGLPPQEPAPGEIAASYRRALPPLVAGLDTGAWIAWSLVGLTLFGGQLPQLRTARREAYRMLVVLAMLRGGNISAAADMLRMTRKVLRENLVRAGMLPWRSAEPGKEGGLAV